MSPNESWWPTKFMTNQLETILIKDICVFFAKYKSRALILKKLKLRMTYRKSFKFFVAYATISKSLLYGFLNPEG